MKQLLMAAILMVSVTAFGSGKITIQPTKYFETGASYPVIGLSIYEPIWGEHLFLNSWTGGGATDNEYFTLDKRPVAWYTTKNTIEYRYGHMMFGAGIQLAYTPTFKDWNNNVHLKMSFDLW